MEILLNKIQLRIVYQNSDRILKKRKKFDILYYAANQNQVNREQIIVKSKNLKWWWMCCIDKCRCTRFQLLLSSLINNLKNVTMKMKWMWYTLKRPKNNKLFITLQLKWHFSFASTSFTRCVINNCKLIDFVTIQRNHMRTMINGLIIGCYIIVRLF